MFTKKLGCHLCRCYSPCHLVAFGMPTALSIKVLASPLILLLKPTYAKKIIELKTFEKKKRKKGCCFVRP
jgi:hypothetical protein